MGEKEQFDVIVIWFFAWLRNIPICWDVFISLYDTVVIDRKILRRRSFLAYLLYSIEWVASRAPDQLFLDTKTHAKYFEKLYQLPSNSVSHVYVGAELEYFKKTDINDYTLLYRGGARYLIDLAKILIASKAMNKKTKNRLRKQLKEEMKRASPAVKEAEPRLGLTIKEITTELAQNFGLSDTSGLVVVQVEKNSAAAEAGLKAGDIILEVDQVPVKDIEAYNGKIKDYKVGDTVLFLVKRKGATLYLTLKVRE